MKRLVLVLATLALSLACETTQRVAWESGLPGVPGAFQVESVEKRAGIWLDARLASGDLRRRIFAPADDAACSSMLTVGSDISWARSEPFGPLSKGDLRCRVAGLGDLETWRNARSRRAGTGRPITSAQTRFTVMRQDEEYTYARGGFSLAGFLGWTPGTDQVVALLPRSEPCDAAPPDEIVTMEYRVEGRPAFALVTRKGLCPIDAVVATPSAEPPDAAPAE